MIEAARRACEAMATARLDTTALASALASWDEPWCIAVVGRVSVGKTTLVNEVTGAKLPTGLGGVTAHPERVPWREAIVVDTQGIDGESLGIARLRPVLAEADAVLWVTDGLQPMTDTERGVLQAAWIPGTQLDIVVSKLDLIDDDDAQQVLERVRALGEAFGARSVTPAKKGAVPDGLLDPSPPSARRVAAVRAALSAAADGLAEGTVDPAQLLDRLRLEWRDRVRNAQKLTVADIEAGELPFKPAALRRLAREIRSATRELEDELPALPGRPALPEPVTVEGNALGQIVAGLGGQHAARSAVRAEAGRLLLEGEVALQEWVAGATDPRVSDAKRAVDEALAEMG